MSLLMLQAYSMLRSAAGLYQFAEEKCAPLLANTGASIDCSAQVRVGKLSFNTPLFAHSTWFHLPKLLPILLHDRPGAVDAMPTTQATSHIQESLAAECASGQFCCRSCDPTQA